MQGWLGCGRLGVVSPRLRPLRLATHLASLCTEHTGTSFCKHTSELTAEPVDAVRMMQTQPAMMAGPQPQQGGFGPQQGMMQTQQPMSMQPQQQGNVGPVQPGRRQPKRRVLTSLWLQVFIYFGAWWDVFYYVINILVFVYKGAWPEAA